MFIEKPIRARRRSRADNLALAIPKCVRVVDERVLVRARQRGCEWPGCFERFTHAAHIKSRGAGGDDVDENVVSLCPAHHAQHHSGQIKSWQLREIVDRRG